MTWQILRSIITDILSLPKIAHSSQLKQAIQYARQGQLDKAKEIYQSILKSHPRNGNVLYHLGNLAQQQKQYDSAIIYYKQAIELQPDFSEAYNEIGNTLQETGKPENAIEYHIRSITLDPHYAEAYNHLGNAYFSLNRLGEAGESYEQALTLNPDSAKAYYNLGLIRADQGRKNEAIKIYYKAIEIDSNFAIAHNNLGNLYEELNQLEKAIYHYKKATNIMPDNAGIQNNLGIAYHTLSKHMSALSCFEHALSLKPDYAEAYNNMGSTYQNLGELHKAENNFTKALTLKKDYTDAISNLLFSLNYRIDLQPEDIFNSHLQYGKRLSEVSLHHTTDFNNSRKTDRRLRIGYVSSDFCNHSVASFFEPILKHHDSQLFEVFCYYNHLTDDATTKRLQGFIPSSHWCNCFHMTDEQLTNKIKKDRIDILVDLNGHSGNNRLSTFATKPSPIQMTYLGYVTTTGLTTMDYRLTDAWADPPKLTERYFTEQLVRMPQTFLCYQPPKQAPPVNDLPSLTKGYITFCSFNNATKINDDVIEIWAEILKALPDSHFLFKAKQFSDTYVQQDFTKRFQQRGITEDRLEFINWSDSFHDHLALYNQADIALDPFPYNGTTTTCESLWMGVPVITLAGKTHHSRVGVSILSNIALSQFIANTPKDFIKIAINLTNDPSMLGNTRKILREKMEKSSLTHADIFTRELENIYSSMWEAWCKKKNVTC